MEERLEEIKNKLNEYNKDIIINALSGILLGMESVGENLDMFFKVMDHDSKNNRDVFTRTSIDLKQMSKVAKSNEYENLFSELDKIKDTLKTGTDITDEIQKRTDLPRDESMRLMTAYILRGKK